MMHSNILTSNRLFSSLQAAAAFASLSAQQSSHYSRQSTPPMSSTNSPKVSSNNTRTPTPTQNLQQNGIPNVPQQLPQVCSFVN